MARVGTAAEAVEAVVEAATFVVSDGRRDGTDCVAVGDVLSEALVVLEADDVGLDFPAPVAGRVVDGAPDTLDLVGVGAAPV